MSVEGQHRARLVVQGDAKSANRELQALAKEQTRLEKEIEKANAALQKQGESMDKTWDKKRISYIKEASAALEKEGKAFDDAAAKARAHASEIRGATEGTSRFTATLQGIGVAAGVFGLVSAGAIATHSAITDLADESFRVSNMFEQLPFSIEPARASTAGLVDDVTLAQTAMRASALGVAKTAGDFAKLTEAAQKLSVKLGMDTTAAFDALIGGVGRGSSAVLDNLGIVLKVEQAHDRYAKSLGKTTKELTDAEKAEAFRVEALKAIFAAAEDVTINTDSASAAVKRFNVEMQNLKTRALGGEQASLSVAKGLKALHDSGQLAGGSFQWVRANSEKTKAALRDLGVSTEDLANLTDGKLFKATEKLRKQEVEHLKDLYLQKQLTAEYEQVLERVLRNMTLLPEETRAFSNALAEMQLPKAIADMERLQKSLEEGIVAKVMEDAALMETKKSSKSRSGKDPATARLEASLEITVASARRVRQEVDRLVDASLTQRLNAIEREMAAERALLDFKLSAAKTAADRGKVMSQIADHEARQRLDTEKEIIAALERDAQVSREIEQAIRDREAAAKAAHLADAQRQREMTAIRSQSHVELVEKNAGGVVDLKTRTQARLANAAAIDEELRAERELLEFRMAHAEGDAERIALESEMRALEHREKLNQIEQEKLARSDLIAAREQQLAKERKITQMSIAFAQQQSQMIGQSMVGLHFAQESAARAAREAGESEEKARKRAAGQFLLGLSQQMAGLAVSEGVQSLAALARYDFAGAGMHAAAAAAAGIASPILSSQGNRLLSEAGGSTSSGGVGAVGRPSVGGGSSGRSNTSDVPASPGPTNGPSFPSQPPPPQSNKGGNTYVINLQALKADKQIAREIRDEIEQLQLEETG